MATIYTVFGGTLVNFGMTFIDQGDQLISKASFVAAGELVKTAHDIKYIKPKNNERSHMNPSSIICISTTNVMFMHIIVIVFTHKSDI